jgi:glycine cleavage system H protein
VRASPGLINADPYGDGWLARLRPASWDEDIALLVCGDAVTAAVEAYMSSLVEVFGVEKPSA